VIATGVQYSVRQFVEQAAGELGIGLRWEGQGVDEVGIVDSVKDSTLSAPRPGSTIVRVDPRYFRPTEVETLLGDASKARDKLGWQPKITFAELVSEMVREDLAIAQRDSLVEKHGFRAPVYHE